MNSRKSRRKQSLRARRKKKLKFIEQGRRGVEGEVIESQKMYRETQVYDLCATNSLNLYTRNFEFRNRISDLPDGREVDTLHDTKTMWIRNKKGIRVKKTVKYSIKVVDTFKHLKEQPITKYAIKKK